MNNFDYKNMTPFKWFVLENFPFIENDFEAINNYQLFSKVVEYLNKTIDNMNLTGEQMENVTNAMTNLQNYVNNYFDNLDVQEEINNKLNQMALDGSLTALIKQYIDPIYEEYENSINNTVNNLTNKVNSYIDNTPQAVSSVSEMTNTHTIYVNTTDGNWYYYNTQSNNWTIGGSYQNITFSKKSIPTSKLKSAKLSDYGSLIDLNEITKNWQISDSYQDGRYNEIFDTTDFIELELSNIYRYGLNQGRVNYYDNNKNWIGFQSISTTNFTKLNPAENTKYVRISYFNNQYSNPVLINDNYYIGTITSQIPSINFPIYIIDDIIINGNQLLDYDIQKEKLNNELQELLRLEFELTPLGNLFDSNYIFKDINFTTANTTPFKQVGYFMTPLIPCKPNHIYQRYTTGGYYIQYFNSNHELIQTDNFTTNKIFTTPENAVNWRISGKISNLNDKTSENYLQIVDSDYFRLTGSNQVVYPKYKTNELYVQTETNILEDKSAIFFGDSWTAGNTSAPGSWCTWIKNKIPSMNIKNAGRFGATWFQGYNYWFEDETHYAEIDNDYDYVIIEAFTNGLYETTPYKTLGTIDEFTFYPSIEYIKNNLPDTVSRDIEIFFNYILNKWAGKKIALLFPYKAVSMMQENNSFRIFREQVIKCANKYNIPIMDNFNSSNIPTFTQEQIDTYFWNGGSGTTGDGVHLNSTGLDLVANKIMSFMKTL